MNFLSISDALASVNNTLSITGNIINISEMESYKNKTGEERTYFTIKVADTSDFTSIRIYNKQLKPMMSVGKTYAFINCLKKEDTVTPLWAISNTQVMAWSPITVPSSVLEKATQATSSNANSPRKLAEALKSQSTSKVQGKIVQSSPVKYVRDGNLAMKHLALKDDLATPAVAISLFGDAAETSYLIGDVISITDVYKYKKADSLSTKPSSTVEFHPSNLLPFEITDKDTLHDPIFEATRDDTVPFTIHGIKYAYIYKSCMKFGCKNKKLKNGLCPNCGSTDSNLYCNARVIAQHNTEFSEHSLFYPELSRLIELPSLSTFNEDNRFLDFLVQALPIQGRGTFTGDKMSVTSIKRKHQD